MAKRILSVVLCALFAAVFIAGCGQQAAAPAAETKAAEAAKPAETAKEAPKAEETKKEEPKAEAKKFKIGFSNASVSNTWRVAMWDMMQKEAKKYSNVELFYADANDNSGKQNSDVDDLLTKGIDCLLIAPATADALNPAIEKAYAKGIPVIVFDRMCTTDKYTTFVVTDDVVNGELSAQRLVEQLKKKNGSEKGNVVIIEGFLGSGPQIDRLKGIMNVLSKYPDIKIVAKQAADFQRAKGQSVMENILQANKKIDAVISESGESLAGAIDAMKAANRLNGMIIENIDGYNGILKAIKAGIVDSTSLFPAGLGKEAFLVGLKVLNGEKVDKLTKLPNIQVTKDNVDKYLDPNAEDGAWTY